MAKILVIDDEHIFCELLKSLLKSHGNDVFTATSGGKGLELFKQHRPHFTILDLRMPEMNGIEVLRHIRAIDANASVMILTAWGSDDLEHQARQLGVIDFLSKTLSLDTILGTMTRALSQPAEAPAPDASAPAIPETDAILVAGGSRQERQAFVRHLTQHGFKAHPVPDSRAALKTLDTERPQLIVLDMDEPGPKELDVPRALREKKYQGGVIMMTARQDRRLLQEAQNWGSVDILGKPVDPERLILAIQVGLVLIRK